MLHLLGEMINKLSRIKKINLKSILYQLLCLIAVVGVLIIAVNNANYNLQKQGVASGFDFLNNPSGFGLIFSLIDYDESSTYLKTFTVGLLNTLLLSFVGIIIATLLGFVIGIARLSKNWLLSKLALVYIEVFRNIPLLLQIFLWYFGLLRLLPIPKNSISINNIVFLNIRGLYIPNININHHWLLILISLFFVIFFFIKNTTLKNKLLVASLYLLTSFVILSSFSEYSIPKLKGFNFTGGSVIIPEFIAMVIALSIYTAAFIAEIVRSGINSVNKGQKEAALSLGLKKSFVLKLIIIPQALRVIIPPLTSQYLNLTKNSSLSVAIAYPDLVSVAGTVLLQTGQAVEVIGMTMMVYLVISLCISILMNIYNKKIALKGDKL